MSGFLVEDPERIRKWMTQHVGEFVDPRTGEVNCTALTEAWDSAESTGEATLDSDHIAWEIAVDVGENFEQANK